MTAREITEQALAHVPDLDVPMLMTRLRLANSGAQFDVLNTNGCCYYQWSACLVKMLKPKQIVELGGAMGVWDICVLYKLPKDSKLHSMTLAEGGLEFSYIDRPYANFFPVVGDDLNLANWPKDLNLNETNLWFFDSLHTEEQLRAELNLYSPFFKKGALVLFDDIHLNDGMQRVWDDVLAGKWGLSDCYDATNPLHWSGYGVCIV